MIGAFCLEKPIPLHLNLWLIFIRIWEDVNLLLVSISRETISDIWAYFLGKHHSIWFLCSNTSLIKKCYLNQVFQTRCPRAIAPCFLMWPSIGSKVINPYTSVSKMLPSLYDLNKKVDQHEKWLNSPDFDWRKCSFRGEFFHRR